MDYDVIIIGAGPAGIAVAESLINTDIQVLIVDSGDDVKIRNYPSNQSESYGDFFVNFQEERKKAFFGTSALWKSSGVGGTFWEFDKSDFENKFNNKKNIRWGIEYSEIKENYKKTKEFLNIKNDINENIDNLLSDAEWKKLQNEYNFKFASTFYTKGDNYEKFISIKKNQILNSRNIKLMLNTTLKHISLNSKKDKVNSINLIDSKNKNLEFVCKDLVIAAGCFENNKILIKLKTQNKLDVESLGKYITFHPSLNIGIISIEGKNFINKKNIDDLNKIFYLKSKTFDTNGEFNCGISITPQNKNIYVAEEVLNEIEFLKKLLRNRKYLNLIKYGLKFCTSINLIKYLIYKYKTYFTNIKKIDVSLVFEHIAEYENYIDLKNDGVSLKINNLLSDKNLNYLKDSIQDNQIKFKQIFNNFKVGDTNISNIKFETNNHHHGGTIIQTEFQKGVVDKNLKFQDISNLYISGSSTFPNSSIYNPTFTIIAMSLRLSNHILSKYVKPPQTKEN